MSEKEAWMTRLSSVDQHHSMRSACAVPRPRSSGMPVPLRRTSNAASSPSCAHHAESVSPGEPTPLE